MQIATIRMSRNLFSSKWDRFLWFFRKKRLTIKLPESWEEVPAILIPQITQIIMTRIDDSDGTNRILKLLMKVKAHIFYNIPSLDFVEKLAPQIDWIYKELMTTAHLYSFTWKGNTYQMPAPNFQDFSFDEFRAADDIYTQMISEVSEATFNEFLQLILREEKDFSKLPDRYKFYALYWFMCCKEQLYKTYFSELEDDKNKSEEKADWEDIKTDIAENATFGTYHKVGKTNVHAIYKWLAKNRKRAIQEEANSLQDQITQNHQNIISK